MHPRASLTAAALAATLVDCRHSPREEAPLGPAAPLSPARKAVATPEPTASAAPAASSRAAALAQPLLFAQEPFQLEPVRAEPRFAISLTAEEDQSRGTSKGSRFVCTTPERPNCVGGYEYAEGAHRFMLSENDFKDERGASTGDRSAHRHPTSLIDKLGAPNCFAGACRGEREGHSFIFEGFDSSKRPRVERLELQIAQSGGSPAEVLEFGEWRYLRYFIKIHRSFGVSDEGVLITQVWQRDSNALLDDQGRVLRTAVGPAFSVNLSAAAEPAPDPRCSVPAGAGTVNVQFSYRNDSHSEWAERNGRGPSKVAFLTCVVQKDQWLGFAIAMQPAHEPQLDSDPRRLGTILIWKLDTATGLSFGPNLPVSAAANYDPEHEGKYRFYWGFRPERKFSSPPDPRGGFTNRFDVRIGIYRASPLYSTLWFDDIKLTNDEACLPGTTAHCP